MAKDPLGDQAISAKKMAKELSKIWGVLDDSLPAHRCAPVVLRPHPSERQPVPSSEPKTITPLLESSGRGASVT